MFVALAAAGGTIDLLAGNVGSMPGRPNSLRRERFLGQGNQIGISRVDWYFQPVVQRVHLDEFRRQFRVSPPTFEYLQRLGDLARTLPGVRKEKGQQSEAKVHKCCHDQLTSKKLEYIARTIAKHFTGGETEGSLRLSDGESDDMSKTKSD